MFSKIPFRRIYMFFGSILALASFFATKPDSAFFQLEYGASTVVMLASLLKATLFVTFMHISRKALFDYIDMGALYRKCLESPVGAGLFAIGVALSLVAITLCILASGVIGG